MLPLLLAYHASYDSTGYGNLSPTGPMIVEGPTKLRILRKPKPVRSVPPRANRASDRKGCQQLALSGAPSRGPDTLKICI
jgi:hypothetical protein